MRHLRTHCCRAVAVIVLLLAVLAACSSGGDDEVNPRGSEPAGSDGETAGVAEVDMADAPGSGRPINVAPPAGGVASPVQNVYYWAGDDNGDEPADGSHMLLLFEPDGAASLMVESEADWLPIGGSWEFDGGSLSLSFSDDSLTVDASFPLDLDADEITMPFRLLSGGSNGESRWVRSTSNPLTYLTTVFLVATGGGDDATGVEGAERAVAYATAVLEANGSGPGGAVGPSNLRAAPVQAPALPDHGRINGVEVIEGPEGQINDSQVRIFWSDGPPTVHLLWTWESSGTDTLQLSPAPQANDPRTHLPTEATGVTDGDPPSNRAVFIDTIASDHYVTWNKWFGPKTEAAGMPSEDMAETLAKRGTTSTVVKDDAAGMVGITDALLDGSGDPGVVVVSTHGGANGAISTHDLMLSPADTTLWFAGDPRGKAAMDAARQRLHQELTDAGYGDLVDYRNAAGVPAITHMGLAVSGKHSAAMYAGLGPAYWDWLREEKGLDLSRSLVFMSTCSVDQSDLRDHVRAGSFWAFDQTIGAGTANAIVAHVLESLVKPSWTAEEAFYNLVRVVNTEQMVYQHDKILDGVLPTGGQGSEAGQRPLFDPSHEPLAEGFVLNAYSMDGDQAVPYAGRGWLDPDEVSGSQVWWMMWAARWGQSAVDGAVNLDHCWNEFWSRGTNGGLASPYCNAANAGNTPTEPEVHYATWLLNGQLPPDDAPTRWTLRES